VAAQFVRTVTAAEQAPMVFDRAFRAALATRSPAVVILPHDVQKLEMPDELPQQHGVTVSVPEWRTPRVLPREDDLRAAADVLAGGGGPRCSSGRAPAAPATRCGLSPSGSAPVS
jgi:pyruvate dehydrogenase (quinone)